LPTSTTRPTGRRAFTLLEVCVTLAVAALAAALVLPRLATRAAGDLAHTVDTVVRRVTTARWRAVVERRDTTVRFADLDPGVAVSLDTPGTPRAPGGAPVVLTFSTPPAALARTLVVRRGNEPAARVTIPAGLGPVSVAWEEPS
jgi:prepilin-type N-terminal cleavage/methylation domain-containing protein